jgi:hypothetical protein
MLSAATAAAAAAAAADVMTSSVTLVQDQKVGVVARRGQTATLGCIDGSKWAMCAALTFVSQQQLAVILLQFPAMIDLS